MSQQQIIIATLGVRPSIVPLDEVKRRASFLADHLARTKREGFVLGISGGQDSLLAGLIAQRAVELRRQEGTEATFHAMLLPYGKQKDRNDAELAIKTIAPDTVHDFNIQPGVDGIAQTYSEVMGHIISDFDKGNIKARVRMTVQYAVAGKHNLLVIGTDHAAEAVTGFFTKFGDGGADILPLSGLSKRQGRAMLKELGVPKVFTTKAPTADLLDNKPAQADESELGIPYDTLDEYLEGKMVSEDTASAIEARYNATQHKRDLPVTYGNPEVQ